MCVAEGEAPGCEFGKAIGEMFLWIFLISIAVCLGIAFLVAVIVCLVAYCCKKKEDAYQDRRAMEAHMVHYKQGTVMEGEYQRVDPK